MSPTDPLLWDRIRDHPLPGGKLRDPASGLWCTTFADALRLQGDWTAASAAAIETEYRRFLYLKAMDGGILTPPACVDEAWHLHMELDPAFFTRFTPAIIHHAELPASESLAAYQRCLTLYGQEFGNPPADVWPTSGQVSRADFAGRLVLPASLLAGVGVIGALVVAGLGGPEWASWLVTAGYCLGFAGIFASIWLASLTEPEKIARCG